MSRLAIFPDGDSLAQAVAEEIAARLQAADGRLVIGCPAGRSPLGAYRAFAALARTRRLDLSQLQILMMDEYVAWTGHRWNWCDREAHYSCRGYAEREILAAWNAGLDARHAVPGRQVHAPDPNAPEAYEDLIGRLGGLDLMLLASGASDGHVGFNPRGTPASAITRVVGLAAETRRDNMVTFPEFATFEETPAHGVTMGPATITRWSKAALMILTGAYKAQAFRRISGAAAYDPDWPATIVNDCADGRIFADLEAAQGRQESTTCVQ